MEKWERFKADMDLFSADERAILMAALRGHQLPPYLLIRLAKARRRTVQRADSDAETDRARRVLVGARLPRILADKYRECAASQGISLYRFVCNALEREYRLTESNKSSKMEVEPEQLPDRCAY